MNQEMDMKRWIVFAVDVVVAMLIIVVGTATADEEAWDWKFLS